MTKHQWHNSWPYKLMMYSIIIFVPFLLAGAAGAFVGWYDLFNSPPTETCIVTHRGAYVCGEVRW